MRNTYDKCLRILCSGLPDDVRRSISHIVESDNIELKLIYIRRLLTYIECRELTKSELNKRFLNDIEDVIIDDNIYGIIFKFINKDLYLNSYEFKDIDININSIETQMQTELIKRFIILNDKSQRPVDNEILSKILLESRFAPNSTIL